MCENARKFCVDIETHTAENYAFIFERVCRLGIFEKEILENLQIRI